MIVCDESFKGSGLLTLKVKACIRPLQNSWTE
jgi:hypothetical protein